MTITMLVAAVALLLLTGSAHATLVFDWRGDCQRILFGADTLCTQATLHVVTTDDYVPGTTLYAHSTASSDPDAFAGVLPYSVLVSATYADGVIAPFDLAFWLSTEQVEVQIPAEGGGASVVNNGQSQFFRSDATGTWKFGGEGHSPTCPDPHGICGYTVTGINGTWTRESSPAAFAVLGGADADPPARVPAPSTVALMAAGLVVALASRWWITRDARSR